MKLSVTLLVAALAVIGASPSTASTDTVMVDETSVTAAAPGARVDAATVEDTYFDDPELGVCHTDPDWAQTEPSEAGISTISGADPPPESKLCCWNTFLESCVLPIGDSCPWGSAPIACQECPEYG